MTGGLTSARTISVRAWKRFMIGISLAVLSGAMLLGATLVRDGILGFWLALMGARRFFRGWINADPLIGEPHVRDFVVGALCIAAATQTPRVAAGIEAGLLQLLMLLGDAAIGFSALVIELVHQALAPTQA